MNQEQGYIKRTITFLIATQVGDKFLDKENCNFTEMKKDEKGNEMMVVDEKNV